MKYNRKCLEIRKLSENPKRDLNLVPRNLLTGKREDPGDEGEILVPDLTLIANLKMATKENT